MFFFNSLVLLCGVCVLTTGLVTLFSSTNMLNTLIDAQVTDVDITTYPYLLIGVGTVLLVLGLMGCAGAIWQNPGMLTAFSVLMILLLLIQLTGAISAFAYKSEAVEALSNAVVSSAEKAESDQAVCNTWNEILEEYNAAATGNNTQPCPACDAWTQLQQTLSCCGIDGENFVCGENVIECTDAQLGNKCQDAVVADIETNMETVAVAALVFAFLQLAATIFSFLLCSSIRSGRTYKNGVESAPLLADEKSKSSVK